MFVYISVKRIIMFLEKIHNQIIKTIKNCMINFFKLAINKDTYIHVKGSNNKPTFLKKNSKVINRKFINEELSKSLKLTSKNIFRTFVRVLRQSIAIMFL